MTEEPRQPSGMQENRTVSALDAPIGETRDQSSQSPPGVGRIEKDAFGTGGQPHRLTSGRSQGGVPGTYLATVDLQIRASHMYAGHAVEKFVQSRTGIRDGAGVYADDPLGAEMGDQSRHGRAGT